MALRKAVYSTSGTFNAVGSGSKVDGTTVNVGDGSRIKAKYISANITVLAQTDTFTIAGKWQVSNDNSTFVDLANGTQNAAAVVFATGTAGVDTAVSKVVAAPESIYGYPYVRYCLVAGGTTGASADTYTLSYNMRSVRDNQG